jgi:hypothetical protein
MTERSDEDLLAAIGTDPGALPAFYLRHIAKVTGAWESGGSTSLRTSPTLSRTCSWRFCVPRVASTRAGDTPSPGCTDWEATSRRPCTASRRACAEQQLQGRALLDAAAMRTMMIEIQPGPKDPPTKDGGPIMSFVPERVAAISVAAFDAKATRIASGIPVTVPEAEAGTGPGIDPTPAAPSRR